MCDSVIESRTLLTSTSASRLYTLDRSVSHRALGREGGLHIRRRDDRSGSHHQRQAGEGDKNGENHSVLFLAVLLDGDNGDGRPR